MSPEVKRAVVREERQGGEKVPYNPAERIEVYMDRLESVFLNPDETIRERNLDMLRDKIYDSLIIKRDNFPESYFELQKRIARERGQSIDEIPADIREQMIDTVIEDQKHSLDAWTDYLTSNDAVYPVWFKYYVWNQVTKLSQFDKERGEFKKRTDSTVAPFPDIYREPLAQIADLYQRVKDDNKDSVARTEFDKKFPTLYAELIQKSLAAQIEGKESIQGQWMKYEQGDTAAAEKLFQSLEGKGTGWCTAGRSTAEAQIDSGDFYVYYTNDSSGEPNQPRLAVRMDGTDRIGEVRGILPHQNVEPLMQEILDKKLGEFGTEADVYRKKSEDMRLLTTLERKQEKGEPFTKEELTFLYEIKSKIEGFGYGTDPRISEMRNQRDFKQDIAMIFDANADEIASDIKQCNAMTKLLIEVGKVRAFGGGSQRVRNEPVIFVLDDARNKEALSLVMKWREIESQIQQGNDLSLKDLKFMYGRYLSKEELAGYLDIVVSAYRTFGGENPYPYNRRYTLYPINQDVLGINTRSIDTDIFKTRNIQADIAILDGYKPEEVVDDLSKISEKTRGYLAPNARSVMRLSEAKINDLGDYSRRLKENGSNLRISFEVADGILDVEGIANSAMLISNYVPENIEGEFPKEVYDLLENRKLDTFQVILLKETKRTFDGHPREFYLKELEKNGLRPATLEELLSLGVTTNGFLKSEKLANFTSLGVSISNNGKECMPTIYNQKVDDGDGYDDSGYRLVDTYNVNILSFLPTDDFRLEDTVFVCVKK